MGGVGAGYLLQSATGGGHLGYFGHHSNSEPTQVPSSPLGLHVLGRSNAKGSRGSLVTLECEASRADPRLE